MSFDVQGDARPRPALADVRIAAPPWHDRSARVYGWLAVTGITAALIVIVGASLTRASWTGPQLPMPRVGPPFELSTWHISLNTVSVALWLAALVGGLGVVAGLIAARRGARPRIWLLLTAAAVVVAILTVLPPVGSTDSLDYMAFGRIMVLGPSPYHWVPADLRLIHDAVYKSIPWEWARVTTPYGPAATLEQFLAAKLGGTSAARIVFWLKLWNGLAFGAVAATADRLLRSDPAGRLRAHLLWTLNPLLIWQVIAAAHLDVLAAAVGMLGLIMAGGWPTAPASGNPRLWKALVGGAFIGVAADIKITFILFGLGLAWALRRSLTSCIAAAAGMLAVILPGYAWFGTPAIRSVLEKGNKVTADNPYQLLSSSQHGFLMLHIAVISTALVVGVAVLTMTRLPFRQTAQPAIFAALALSTAWLFVWQYQLPSYDAMIICLLILVPVSWLDWLVMARLTAGTIALMPGNPTPIPQPTLAKISLFNLTNTVPVVLMSAAVGLIVLCLSERRRTRRLSRLEPGPNLV